MGSLRHLRRDDVMDARIDRDAHSPRLLAIVTEPKMGLRAGRYRVPRRAASDEHAAE